MAAGELPDGPGAEAGDEHTRDEARVEQVERSLHEMKTG